MKYVRQLIRIENELDAWAGDLEYQAQWERPPQERAALENRAEELRVLARRIHTIADDFSGMPIRMRELVERALDPYRG